MNNSVALLEKATPMMRQYFENKQEYQDSFLFFRMGDFYELFYDDAIKAAPILEVTLTRRGKTEGQDIPMCGVPHHSVNVYIQKLIKAGHKVAVCDQLESPEEAKKRGYSAIVKREVTRVITQGTLTEDNLLDGKAANYLAALVVKDKEISIAYAELSTLNFYVLPTTVTDLANDLTRVNPSELLITDDLLADKNFKEILSEFKARLVTFAKHFFKCQKCERKVMENFELCTTESIAAFSQTQIAACGALLDYLCITQKKDKVILKFPKLVKTDSYVVVDKSTMRNLEIFNSVSEHGCSLYRLLDKTLTNAGGRLLRQFLSFPSKDKKVINSRLHFVTLFVMNKFLCEKVSSALKGTPDLERSLSRLAINRAAPRDLYYVRQALENAEQVSKALVVHGDDELKLLSEHLIKGRETLELLNSSLVNYDVYMNQGDYIIRGYSQELNELYNFRDNTKDILNSLREEYRCKTGVQNLKLEFNNMIGYYLEVTKTHLSKIQSDEFIHRQTMVNGVRYVTEKLKEVETKILNVKAQILNLEDKIFSELSNKIISKKKELFVVAKTLAFIDVIRSFAKVAYEQKYCRPIVDESMEIEIQEGRHPVVEHWLSKSSNEKFIPNNCILKDNQQSWLITGPNMAGKSTFLRQNALIVILAHIGSYVPAREARIGLVDRIFSRVGAEDDLARGRSTFLVEMIETATILNQATERSFIILDEIGRGTSTYDGIAIAWSCLEYIHDNSKPRTLFSTHYHELVELANSLANLKCYTVSVKEWQDKVIFMRKVIPGVASKSYGINVAAIAGLPKEVVARAKEVLKKLHVQDKKEIDRMEESMGLFAYHEENKKVGMLLEELKKLDVDNLSPREALDALYKLKDKVSETWNINH